MVQDVDEGYFQDLLDQIDDHPKWEYADSDRSFEDIAATAAAPDDDYRTVDVGFINRETGAPLRVILPSYDQQAGLSGHLRNSLLEEPHHSRLPPSDSFPVLLEEVYEQIAEENVTEYLTPAVGEGEGPNYDLLYVTVPWEYDAETLDETLTALDRAAWEVDTLNNAVMGHIDAYLSGE